MRPTTRDLWGVNKYLWLCLVFVALFIPWAAKHQWLRVHIAVAYGVFGLALLNGAARTYLGWKSGGFNEQRGWVFTLVDLALIAAAIWITGGLESELWLAYFVLLISESLFSPAGQTLFLLVCMVAGYAAATWSEHLQPDYFVTFVTRMFFLGVVGSFGRQLSEYRVRRNHEIALLHEQVAASEERARIAREVHDSLGHALVASILRLELCSRLIKKAPEEAEKLLQEEVPALRAAWTEGRNLVFHLRPWEKDPAGFAQTLRRHVSRFAERTGLAVNLEMAEEGWELRPEAELVITRILQEALTNVAKHAQASSVSIQVKQEEGTVRCRITDDGVGFDPEACDGSFGLRAMRERAEKLNGRVIFISRPGEGTTVEVTVPAH
jgi:signal transduction histidine kinase